MEGYQSISLDQKVKILKQLTIWAKMNIFERENFLNSQNEFYADRLMRDLRRKYLTCN
jgi:hypothetical protein